MKATVIDMSSYPRRAHFDYFRSLQNPYVGVTVNVDVTELVAYCKRRGISFYLTLLHAAALAADCVPALRQRIRDGGIVQYDACGTSHIELLEDGTYCYCTLYHEQPFGEYIAYAERQRRQCRENPGIEEDADVEGLYFISTLPWLHYTALVQPTAGGDESNPRISWGRFQPDGAGRLQLPVTLLANHALVDGLHLAGFYSDLEKEIERICKAE